MENDAETAHQWRVALRLLREISALEPDAAGRAGRIQEAHAFFAGSGVERLEKRIEKPLKDLSRAEADTWIERLTPEQNADGGTG